MEGFPPKRMILRAPRQAPPALQMPGHYLHEHNRLLANLPASTVTQLSPHLELAWLPLGEVLYDHGKAVSHAYFPIDAIAARLYVTAEGQSAATSIIGNEGVVGIPLFLEGGSMLHAITVQCAGHAWRIPAGPLMAEFNRRDEFFRRMLLYIQTVILQGAQTAVCNRHHPIEQQLCRLLLLLTDASASVNLPITQERLSGLLGVRRESVTAVAGSLQKRGAIHCTRGCIAVRDRPQLEALACECYGVVRTAIDRMLPTRPTRRAPFATPRGAILPRLDDPAVPLPAGAMAIPAPLVPGTLTRARSCGGICRSPARTGTVRDAG